jgi:hypothetical protein
MAALYDPGEKAHPPGQVIRILPFDVGNKALGAQFIGENAGSQLPLERGSTILGARPPCLLETVPVAAGLSIASA